MRFIAGAVCPACGAKDTLRAEVSTDSDTQSRECVDCGFTETASSEQSNAQPDTRVEQKPMDDGRQVIKIMPPVSKTKH